LEKILFIFFFVGKIFKKSKQKISLPESVIQTEKWTDPTNKCENPTTSDKTGVLGRPGLKKNFF